MDQQENPVGMPSATCHPVEAGFTLLETIVVLAILAIGVGVALPRLLDWADRLRFSSAQERLEEALSNLGSEARQGGHTKYLRSIKPGIPRASDDLWIELPYGWELVADPPIAIHYDGVCTGGTLSIIAPGAEAMRYRLTAPYCRPERL